MASSSVAPRVAAGSGLSAGVQSALGTTQAAAAVKQRNILWNFVETAQLLRSVLPRARGRRVAAAPPSSASSSVRPAPDPAATAALDRDIARSEGITALWRGIGPTLVGAIPARYVSRSVPLCAPRWPEC